MYRYDHPKKKKFLTMASELMINRQQRLKLFIVLSSNSRLQSKNVAVAVSKLSSASSSDAWEH